MNPFKLAWLHLTRNWDSTLLAVLAISLSVAGSGILLRLDALSKSRFQSLDAKIDAVVGAKAGGLEILLGALNAEGPYPDFVPYRLFQSLQVKADVHFEDGSHSDPNYIKTITPFLFFAKIDKSKVAATDESFLKNHPLSQGNWPKENFEIVIGTTLAQKLNLGLGQNVSAETWSGDSTTTQPLPLKISGILSYTGVIWDQMAFSNLPTAWQVLQQENIKQRSIWKEQVLHYFLVELEPMGLQKLQSLINQRTVAQAISVPVEMQKLKELLSSGEFLEFLGSALVLILGSLTVLSVLSIRFQSIQSQVAVLRALGYSKMEILYWLLWEGSLLGLSSIVLGAALDFLFFPLIQHSLRNALPNVELISIPWWTSGIVWLTAMIATLLAGVIPYFLIDRKSIHDSLREL